MSPETGLGIDANPSGGLAQTLYARVRDTEFLMPIFMLPARAGRCVVIAVAVFIFMLVALLPLPFHLQSAHAQAPQEPLTILITASRVAETADETLSPVTVITRRQIEQTQANTVQEVLRTVPGLTLSNNGGGGQLTTLFLRGANSNHVLTLIDGVKVGSATSGLTQFEHLPLDQIEKIEVVRGPRSSLYGSEAIGGVIQIFTRAGGGGDGAKTRTQFSISGGSHNTHQAHVGVRGGAATELGRGRGWYNLGFASHLADGYDVCRAAFCIDERDADGYQNHSISARGGASPTEEVSVEGNVLHTASETEFDGFFNSSQNLIRTVGLKTRWQAHPRWQTSFALAHAKDDLESFSNGVSASRFVTDRAQANWQNDIQLSATTRLAAGVDYVADQVDGSTDFTVTHRDNVGFFTWWRSEFNEHDVEFSLRHDEDEQFGGQTTGSLGWGRRLGERHRLTASYGTAFKAPHFNVLYTPQSDAGIFSGTDFGIFRSNPELQPETSKSFNVGFSRRGKRAKWEANWYQTTLNNLIASRTQMQTIGGVLRPVSRPVNVQRARIVGVELTASAGLRAWDVRSTLSWQEATQTAGDRNGKRLLKRPQRNLDLDISRRFGTRMLAVNVFAQSSSLDFGETAVAGFALVNVRGEFRLERNWSLGLKINNLLDKQYQTAAGYPQDGLNVLATLRYAPTDS